MKKIEIYFCVLLRVYRLVFITILMYNPLWKIVMGPHAACKGGVNCFIKKNWVENLKNKLPRARGGDEATTFAAVEPLRQAP
jgi:hypothetical protein